MDGTSVIEPGAPPAAIDSRGRLEHRHDVAACFKFPDLNVKSNRILFEARSWRLEFVHVKTVARCDNCVHKIERDGRWCRRGVWKTDEQLELDVPNFQNQQKTLRFIEARVVEVEKTSH